jgi:hypothetical protein
VGLVTASIATNTAIDFCRRLQEDFEKAFPGQEPWDESACIYCSFLEHTETLDFGDLQGDGRCLMNVHRILEIFVDGIEDNPPNELPAVSPACIQPYLPEPQADQESGQCDDRVYDHFSLLMGILPEMYALTYRMLRTSSSSIWMPELRNHAFTTDP